MDPKWKYSQNFQIRNYEVGPSGLSSMQTICGCMEETAGRHADLLGLSVERLNAEGVTWVLARAYIEAYHYPEAGQELKVVTWPVQVEKLQFRRDFAILDHKDEVIGKAVTQWVIVNLESRRVVRIPAYVAGVSPEDPEHVLPEPAWRIPPQSESPETGSFKIRLADIDRNRHVNNVRFIDFITESTPLAHDPAYNLAAMEILYRAESLYGDEVIAKGQVATDTPQEYATSLYRLSDNLELVRARSVWRRGPA